MSCYARKSWKKARFPNSKKVSTLAMRSLSRTRECLLHPGEKSANHCLRYFVNKKLNSGPNQWPSPETFPGVDDFRRTCMDYYYAVVALAKDILKVIALCLDLSEDHFREFATDAVATMRLLHYPPTEKGDGAEKLQRGIGAHTDFGAVTLLLQDEVDGLQVWDKEVEQWFDVREPPAPLPLCRC